MLSLFLHSFSEQDQEETNVAAADEDEDPEALVREIIDDMVTHIVASSSKTNGVARTGWAWVTMFYAPYLFIDRSL